MGLGAVAQSSYSRFVVKRVFDIIVGSGLIVVLSPLLALTALAIKLDSRGPILFSQPRAGATPRRDGDAVVWERSTFTMYKFRSMVHGADQSAHEQHIEAWVTGGLAPDTEHGQTFKLEGDDRITRVGHLIRRTSIDELPQLINVVKGDMSLVGPRPVPLYEAAAYEERHLRRLESLPGITGIWQVQGRGRVTFEEMIDMDLEYVERQSLMLDVRLLLATLPAALSGKGAR